MSVFLVLLPLQICKRLICSIFYHAVQHTDSKKTDETVIQTVYKNTRGIILQQNTFRWGVCLYPEIKQQATSHYRQQPIQRFWNKVFSLCKAGNSVACSTGFSLKGDYCFINCLYLGGVQRQIALIILQNIQSDDNCIAICGVTERISAQLYHFIHE